MPRFVLPCRRWAAAPLLLTGLLAAAPLAAQTASTAPSDSLPFRQGQWGAEFGLGSYTSAGFVRFRSPRRAWVGTVSGDYSRQTPEGTSSARTSARVSATVGHRWFRAILPDVSQFVTLGGVIGAQRSDFTLQQISLPELVAVEARLRRSSYFAGVAADVGAQWMVTPSLALGAKWGAQAVVGRDQDRLSGGLPSNTDATGTSTSLILGRIAVLGSLYF